jgi:hypothetical protein
VTLKRGPAILDRPFSILNFYACAADKNGNGVLDCGDDFAVAEYLVNGTNVTATNVLRQVLAGSTVAQSYSLALINYLNRSNEVFFTGEPDGQVFAWTVTNSTGPLQRQLFSAQHTGKAWHALAGVKTLDPGEGLLGLRVDPANPSTCDVIFWPPQPQLWAPANVRQTAPVAVLQPAANALSCLAQVPIRLSDAEGNASLPFLQYSNANARAWSNATVVQVDGTNYSRSLCVAALPSGSDHVLVWDALGDLGPVRTNVFLRVRAKDITLLGDWSVPTPYAVDTIDSDGDGLPDAWEMRHFGNLLQGPNDDLDHDGFTNIQEYLAGTDPTDPNSYLRITGLRPVLGGMKIDWLGGTNGIQYLQRADTLNSNTWADIFTNPAPTPFSGSYTDMLGTNAMQFYRVRVGQ